MMVFMCIVDIDKTKCEMSDYTCSDIKIPLLQNAKG